MPVKFYCEVCEEFQPVEIEPIQQDELNDHPWGDIVCAACHFVIATITADQPGQYRFIREGTYCNPGSIRVCPLEQLPLQTQYKIHELRINQLRGCE